MTHSVSGYLRQAELAAREERILSNLALVKHALGRLTLKLPLGVDTESLESAGVAGLVEAANRFDESAGASFATFAYRRIQGAILDEIRKHAHYSPDVNTRIRKLMQIREEYPFMPLEEQAALAGLSNDEAFECLRLHEQARHSVLQEDGADRELETNEETGGSALERKERLAALTSALKTLPERHRQALVLFYFEELRNSEIAEVLRLSQSRTSRLLEEARAMLRDRLQGAF